MWVKYANDKRHDRAVEIQGILVRAPDPVAKKQDFAGRNCVRLEPCSFEEALNIAINGRKLITAIDTKRDELIRERTNGSREITGNIEKT